ncbi:hypothetical protein D0B54_14975 [Solimonas sp. K1W22B-7]|uniref:phytanoyl-CoA dioxygenase family protein n=1 Tax=Solimonas sp. K1W22B-7 TaxID=2303331 RepID=UPI000E32E5FF|nr:phytanoyl-CoA dioxygenase family protein [Solimonas sp. K1W22B-7]AXQ29900.1 hypothetical protein D0B54_14975 [Solimonas sp. K1W22B-7]
MSLSSAELESLERNGFAGPFSLERQVDCDAVEANSRRLRFAGEWYKGAHVFKGPAFDASTDSAITSRLRSALGENLVMWSSELMLKPPGQPHRWHVDIEAMTWRTLNIWMALRNVTDDSTLRLVPGSHRWGAMLQNLPDVDLQDEASVLAAARRYDPTAVIQRIPMKAGQFAIFDGRAWHGTENPTARTRTALLCQYSPPAELVRQPLSYGGAANWAEELPACVVVSGSAADSPSRIVEPRNPTLRQTVQANLRSTIGFMRRLPQWMAERKQA